MSVALETRPLDHVADFPAIPTGWAYGSPMRVPAKPGLAAVTAPDAKSAARSRTIAGAP